MIESLPDDLLTEILVRLSADEIYDNARVVCRRWRHLIHTDDFVQTHFHRTSSGVLMEVQRESPRILVTATTKGGVEISKFSSRLKSPILPSCNGLALSLRKRGTRGKGSRFKSQILCISNPTIKRGFNLPKFPVTVRDIRILRMSLAYAAASMAYKVFGSYHKSGKKRFVILTVGVDNTWRHVAVEGLSDQSKRLISYSHVSPLTTGCFLHWVSKTHVLSLNVETETFTEPPFPAHMFATNSDNLNHYLSTGECISLFIPRGDWSWEVWEMKPETWEWRKFLPKLDLEAHKCKIQRFASYKYGVLKPVGWVRYPELLAFLFSGWDLFCSWGRYCIIYNLDTEEFESTELELFNNNKYPEAVQYRSSLVWPEWC